MNPRKLAAICCTNDEAAYRECQRYLKALRLPAGFELEFVPVTGASGLAAGYNEGMRRTDARYKVYLHQDALIVHPDFLLEVVRLFQAEPSIGIVGLVGARRLPKSGVWWDTEDKVGKVFHTNSGRMDLLDLGAGETPWTEVEAVDGIVMATQYDLPWREDLFPAWDFYDISQCKEFALAGYKIAVPYQEAPWCVHDCGRTEIGPAYAESLRTYLAHYGTAGARDSTGARSS